MKLHFYAAVLLVLIAPALFAQNDANLYDVWKDSYQTTTWAFNDRPDDDVDYGSWSFKLNSTMGNCACKGSTSVPFDWKSENGKVNMYFNLSDASVTTDVTCSATISESYLAEKKKNCKSSAEQSLIEFKRDFEASSKMSYSISGNTLKFGGKYFYSTSTNKKVTQQKPVETKPQTVQVAEAKTDEGVKAEILNGYHVKTFANGNRYEGEWMNNKMHGQGTYTTAYDKYAGQWKDDFKHGQGTHTYTDGDTYVGEWQNGLKHGKGTHTKSNGERYTGEYKFDARDGQGTQTYTDGSSYTGQWAVGKMHGQGTFKWADGSSYTGQWANNEMNGQGIYISETGEKMEGEFKDGNFLK